MRTTTHLPIVALLLSLLALANTGQGQALSPFARWARAHAMPLARPGTSTTADLRRFATVVGDARVVALGEPAHGAEEPLAFRNRLFRYLVEHHGFTAIAIESSLPDSWRVDAYINGAPGDAQEVARNHIGYGFGELRASVELLEWMRAYNADPGHRRKLHFYGIDLALGGAGGSTPRPVAFLDPLTLLARVDSAAAIRLRTAVAPLLRLTDDSTLSASPAQLDTFTLATDELLRRLERARPLLVAEAPNDYEWGYRTAVGAHQAIWVHRVLPKGSGDGVPPGAWEAIETRDAAMADNVQWAVSREGLHGRVLVFAHNGHVMNAVNRGSIWNALARPPKMMGVHLRSMFGRDVVIIGQSGGASTDTAVKVVPDTAGLDEALGSVGLRHFAVDLRATRVGTPERRWLEVVRPMRANLRLHHLLRPIEAFDAIVYIDTLRPAARVKRAP